jgi:hypothetical protein
MVSWLEELRLNLLVSNSLSIHLFSTNALQLLKLSTAVCDYMVLKREIHGCDGVTNDD